MIISAGEALVDVFPASAAGGPDDGSPASIARPGGGPMNTAIACARLGVPTAFLGRVSTDAHGEAIWAHLLDSGVDLRVAQRGPEPTTVAEVVGDPPQFVFHGEGTADAAPTEADLSVLGPGPHVLHGGTLGMFREPAAEVFARTAEANTGLVSLDPNIRPAIIEGVGRARWEGWFHRWLAQTDLLRASSDDLAWLWPGVSTDDVALQLLGHESTGPGVGAVVITTAEHAEVHTVAGSVSVPSRKVEVIDTVGAGDSFVGGMLVALVERGVTTRPALDGLPLNEWRDVLAFASTVASITCSRVGADPPRRADLPV